MSVYRPPSEAEQAMHVLGARSILERGDNNAMLWRSVAHLNQAGDAEGVLALLPGLVWSQLARMPDENIHDDPASFIESVVYQLSYVSRMLGSTE